MSDPRPSLGREKTPALDPAEFIKANLQLAPVSSLPEIRLYTAHPGSGLRRLLEPGDGAPENTAGPQPPYWAYAWAGGAVLARYVLDRPSIVAGRRVLDLGAGSGLVGIAAAKAGASEVIAAEIDRNGAAALRLNAAANGVAISIVGKDITAGPPPAVDLVLAGDVFYGRAVARQVVPFLDRCLAAGIEVLVGDPGRAWLPRQRLRLLAEYQVPDVGGNGGGEPKPSGVFAFVAEKAD
ncbi:methyltransferase [Mesorhizobium sp. M1C.F.Ca.ET.193.01.1.1]|uniref:class I SAM-dependent methyltransferase n=1 Tax=unclassified Mesorhizobium TaxID=325217 RepID=UPI000FD38F4E|nr:MULTISPECIES: 50S ribosomal protein L11 methyltransferase [unclassified Mesorhizobium]TGT04237.1 methyltransferase [bacterium M00.F.Ca.ET.177.01.1.1]RWA77495.1 MAG: methyltransferase [Mesorhizobium sp.]RWC05769.1 MAG: methyltransferase [Mesorhizobium sp.]TGQ56827.1 methyltransferase [Mesorhizobium sp. M1C.F.Ca.ET.210.01.1.1]TGQ75595.1 methyltransferase [Mesorhizobium sp. M1C.F.Ca.ET.212.01.1.1]